MKCIKSENGDFNKVWPPATSQPITVQKDQVISLYEHFFFAALLNFSVRLSVDVEIKTGDKKKTSTSYDVRVSFHQKKKDHKNEKNQFQVDFSGP